LADYASNVVFSEKRHGGLVNRYSLIVTRKMEHRIVIR